MCGQPSRSELANKREQARGLQEGLAAEDADPITREGGIEERVGKTINWDEIPAAGIPGVRDDTARAVNRTTLNLHDAPSSRPFDQAIMVEAHDPQACLACAFVGGDGREMEERQWNRAVQVMGGGKQVTDNVLCLLGCDPLDENLAGDFVEDPGHVPHGKPFGWIWGRTFDLR